MTYTETLELLGRKTSTQNSTTSSYTTAQKTVDINNALNWYFILANSAAGNWRPVDDTNQTDYPIVYFDLVSGQQDYTFTVDEQGNQITDFDRIRIKNRSGVFYTLDQLSKDDLTDEQLNNAVSGSPSGYFMTSNGIFLDCAPNYSTTDGGEISGVRTPTYFLTGDTTKKAGIPWVHHEYLALRPAYFYCLDKGLPQAPALEKVLFGPDGKSGMEGMIKKYYSRRNRNFTQQITAAPVNSI